MRGQISSGYQQGIYKPTLWLFNKNQGIDIGILLALVLSKKSEEVKEVNKEPLAPDTS